VAGPTSGAGIAITAPAASAAAMVGIVINGGNVSVTRCVAAGQSGDAILNLVASVNYRPRDGIITQIDNYPAAGVTTDDNHYWAYFHNTGSGWAYSNVGANGYVPAAGTVEGWNYDNGSSIKPAPAPPAVSFASICGSPAPPAPSPSAPPTTSAAVVPTAAKPTTTTASPIPGAPQPGVAVPTAQESGGTPTSSQSAPGTTETGQSGSTSAFSSIDASAAAKASPAKKPSSGSVTPLLIAAALVVALAVGAFVATRRRRAS
jgi:hypothetical protein